MTTRTKWTLIATLIFLLYGFGIVWWWTYLPPDLSRQPEIFREYKSAHLRGH
jgi:hypothetical protein